MMTVKQIHTEVENSSLTNYKHVIALARMLCKENKLKLSDVLAYDAYKLIASEMPVPIKKVTREELQQIYGD